MRNHRSRLLADKFEEMSTILYVEDQGEVVASLRKTWLDNITELDSLADWYSLDWFHPFPRAALCITSRFMVAADYRGTAAGRSLCAYAHRISRERQTAFDFCHCALRLTKFMTSLGYRPYKEPFIDPEVGERVPLVAIYEDVEYLQSVRFHFLEETRRWPNSGDTRDWFEREIASRITANAAALAISQ